MPARLGANCADEVDSLPQRRSLNCASDARLPNLFVVGAAKAGTTALHQYFRLHPDVFVPQGVKEINYMSFFAGLPPLRGPKDQHVARNAITRLDDYRKAYSLRTAETVAIDVSPSYLYFPQAAHRIAELCPQAKIVMLLRNPVDCAFSMYSMMRRDRREPCRDFRTAYERTDKRLAAGWQWFWDLKGGWRYAQQIAAYLDLFAPSQLFIRRYEEFKNNADRFYRELAVFLDVPLLDVAAANRRVNTAPSRQEMLNKRRLGRLVLRSAHIASHLVPTTLREHLRSRVLDTPAFVLNAADRRLLTDQYAADIRQLERLLKWDLSDWLGENRSELPGENDIIPMGRTEHSYRRAA